MYRPASGRTVRYAIVNVMLWVTDRASGPNSSQSLALYRELVFMD